MERREAAMRRMRALTLWRPWTDAILYAGKRIENRPWKPWPDVIGDVIALHAGLRYDVSGARWMEEAGLYVPPGPDDSPKGIVGLVRVTGWRESNPILFSEPEPDDPWFSGPYGWELDDEVTKLAEPIPCKGAQGLWYLPDLAMERLEGMGREVVTP